MNHNSVRDEVTSWAVGLAHADDVNVVIIDETDRYVAVITIPGSFAVISAASKKNLRKQSWKDCVSSSTVWLSTEGMLALVEALTEVSGVTGPWCKRCEEQIRAENHPDVD